MTRTDQATTASVECSCRQTALQLFGSHIYCTSCHCDDCQLAAQQIQKEYGATEILDSYLGTHCVLHRKDRYTIQRGAENLKPHKLREKSKTHRMIATCCGTPLFIGFDNAPHWISVYRQQFSQQAPALESRIMTKYVPASLTLPDTPPAYKSFPMTVIVRLVTSKLQMLLGR